MAALELSTASVAALGATLVDGSAPIERRNRAAYWLRERGSEPEARAALVAGLRRKGDSVLLRHELAYVLGQLGFVDAVDDLCAVVRDTTDDPIVRHESAEALGAIGDAMALSTLVAHCDDGTPEVAETCRLSVALVGWRARGGEGSATPLGLNEYRSVDPTPAAASRDVDALRRTLVSDEEDAPLWERYRAMFALRDLATDAATMVLAEALLLPKHRLSSDLCRHEVAFVLGQLARACSAPALASALKDATLHSMVRHEAAEALGAIGGPDAARILADYTKDPDPVVAQSCVVALDALEYYDDAQPHQPTEIIIAASSFSS